MKRSKHFGAIARLHYRITDMRDGTYRPEVYEPGACDILFMEPVLTTKEASRRAKHEAEERRRAWLADQVEQLTKRPLANFTQLALIAVH